MCRHDPGAAESRIPTVFWQYFGLIGKTLRFYRTSKRHVGCLTKIIPIRARVFDSNIRLRAFRLRGAVMRRRKIIRLRRCSDALFSPNFRKGNLDASSVQRMLSCLGFCPVYGRC
jgi:hypothetical protein